MKILKNSYKKENTFLPSINDKLPQGNNIFYKECKLNEKEYINSYYIKGTKMEKHIVFDENKELYYTKFNRTPNQYKGNIYKDEIEHREDKMNSILSKMTKDDYCLEKYFFKK